MTGMTAHLAAIAAKLAVTYPVDLFASDPGRTGQWMVVEAPPGSSDADAPLEDCGAFEVEVRIRAVTGTPTGVALMLDHARETLPGPIAVAGRVAEVRWESSEFIDLDTNVTNPNTNRHPAVGLDSYVLTSQPA